MSQTPFKLRKFLPDLLFVGISLIATIAAWVYPLPVWVLAICLVVLVLAVVSLLGEFGLFGGTDQDS